MKPWRTTARLALRLARARHPQQRLRVILLGTVALVTAMTALFTAGVLHALTEESGRFEDRTVRFAPPGEDVAVRVDRRDDTWGLTQYPVVWLDPVDTDDPAALPPGMVSWPEPGGWVVSPGLAELAEDHPDLAERFPDPHVLTGEGVLHPGELLAYRRIPAGGFLGEYAVDATGFGGPGPTIGDDTELDIPAMSLALAGFVGLPLLLLAAAGTAVSAPLRAHRLALLHALGVPTRRRRTLVVLEAAAIFLPGLALGTLAWHLLAPHITRIPVVDRPITGGDLVPPVWSTTAVIAFLAMVFAALSVLTERRHRDDRHATAPRPRAGRPRLSGLRAGLALAGTALLAAAALRDGRWAATATLAGVVLLAAGIPLALPLIARRAGDRLAKNPASPGRVLAGRRLQYDPRSAVRPLYGIAALLVITPVIAAWITAVRAIDPPPPADPTVQAFELRGALSHTDFDTLLHDLPDATAAPLTVEPGPGNRTAARIGASCADLDRLLERPVCTSDGLDTAAERRLGLLVAGTAEVSVTLVPPDLTALTADDTLLVLTPRRPGTESTLRSAALAQPGALTVLSEADHQLQESDLVPWILGGITLFSTLVFLVLATGLIDRSADGRRGARLLTSLGLTRRRIRTLNGQEFLIGYGVVAGTGMTAGIVASLAWTQLDPAITYPLEVQLVTTTITAALAAIGLLGVHLSDQEPGR
ncbi:FtsX-like permease family protein [Streptomyces sp. RFCAC02]|uniref:FtsX-like permease family protein n=1 Tax=Streptomyces sp. RFCAC02 TaxID=2499143 RepID=UPI00102072AE|nr:FtsX-like permease family protein [Streptomyces sp. RFCAC02]